MFAGGEEEMVLDGFIFKFYSADTPAPKPSVARRLINFVFDGFASLL
jgi:hypothetical protein